MRKITLFLAAIFCVGLINAQTQVFLETFGEEGPTTGNPRGIRIGEYTDYDNGAPVTFTETDANSYADIRATSNMNTHVWFSATRSTDIIISNIPTEGHNDLKLTFDITSNYNGTTNKANLNKLTLYCNDAEITLPSKEIATQNEYISSGEITIPNAATTKLRFLFTAENNPQNYGYRIDNVKITAGGGGGTNLISISKDAPSFFVSGNQLMAENIEEGTMVEIYNAVGAKVTTSFVIGNSVELNNNLNKGIYIIKAGDHTQKIMF